MVFSGTVASDYEKLIDIPDPKRPELIDVGAVDFSDIRSRLIQYVKAVYPNDYNKFADSDLGMMFIDLFSYVGQLINYKAELFATENVLGTATKRSNVADLLELIGVRLRGPISAVGDAKITLPQTPSNFSLSPARPVKILAEDRTVTVLSPEDGAPVTYTLYKVASDGTLDSLTSDAQIELYKTEADNSASTVFTNLAFAEGSFGIVSGTFASPEAIKSIDIPTSPVIEGSVEVFIISENSAASGPYREVRNIYFASSTEDKIYQVTYGDDFSAKVVFGDGTVGISPPNGSDYVVTYRVGGGTRGNNSAELINVIKQVKDGASYGTNRSSILESISKITGGTNSETIEHAKKYAPLTYRRQDRCVTLEDYTVFANAFRSSFGTIGKARAVTRDAFCAGNVIDVYVLEQASDTQLKRATPQFKKELLAAYDPVKMITDEIVIVDGVIRTLDLAMTITVDSAFQGREEVFKQAVIKKIQDFFRVDNFDFGKELVLAELARSVWQVPEVRYSQVDNFDKNVRVDFNEIIQLNNLTLTVAYF